MIRPTTLLLVLAIGAFALSTIAIALEDLPDDAGLYLFAILALIVFADVIISRARGGWSIALDGPDEVFVDERNGFEIGLNRGIPTTGLVARIAFPEGLEGPSSVPLGPTGEGAAGHIDVRARRRGSWDLDHIWLTWVSRLRLVLFCPRLKIDARINAVPNIRPVQSGKIDVAIRSSLMGVKENILKGEGSEFHQLRDYVTGMDPRTIDWKQSARHRALVAKEMRAERNHHVIVALDNGYLMREEVAGLPKIDHAVNAGLALTWAAGLGGDLVGLYAFDAKPSLYIPPEPARPAFAKLRRRLAGLEYRSIETNHTLAMAHLHAQVKRRSLIVVFSDFVDTTTAELLVENIAVLNRAHVIVFVALRDPEIERIATATPDGLNAVARSVSAGEMLHERREVMRRLQRIGVLVVDAEPQAITARLLSTYLTIKSREMI